MSLHILLPAPLLDRKVVSFIRLSKEFLYTEVQDLSFWTREDGSYPSVLHLQYLGQCLTLHLLNAFF